jgi:hypothetical protein
MGQDITGWRLAAASDNVVFLVGFGEWREPVARRFSVEFKDMVEKLGDDWALLGDATDWNLNDPAVQRILMDMNRWIVFKGCRAGCFYTGPGALNRLLLYRLAVPDGSGYRFRVYPDRARSVAALDEAGFPVTEDQLSGFFRGEGKRA